MNLIAKLNSVLTEFAESPKRGTYYANCPLCVAMGEDRLDERRRLGITLRGTTRAAHCFNCGWKGTVNQLLKTLGKGGADLRAIKAAQDEGGTEKEKPKEFLPLDDPAGYLPITDPRCVGALRYLTDRGFNEDVLKAYRFGYARRGYFARRLIIPIRFNKMTVGFQGRLLMTPEKRGRKYMFNEGFDASRALFNFDAVKDLDEVVIVEGALDCLRHLSDRGIALFTNKMSARQKILIITHFKRVIVMLDWGFEKEGLKIVHELEGFVPTVFAQLPQREDPASATQEQVDEAIATASVPSLKMLLSAPEASKFRLNGRTRVQGCSSLDDALSAH